MKDTMIIGAGGFGREVAWLIADLNKKGAKESIKVLAYIDSGEQGIVSTALEQFSILGDDDWAIQNLPKAVKIVISIGDPKLRKSLAEKYESNGFVPLSLIHPSAQMSELVNIGLGSILCANAVLTVDVKLGRHCIVNLGATIGHDCVLGDFVTIGPGCHLSGGVQIGEGAQLGSGAVVLPGIHIGDHSIIGAGAVVTQHIPAGKVAVVVPAKINL